MYHEIVCSFDERAAANPICLPPPGVPLSSRTSWPGHVTGPKLISSQPGVPVSLYVHRTIDPALIVMNAPVLSKSEPPSGDRRYAVSVRLHGAVLQNRKLLITRLTTGGRRCRVEAPAGAIKASGTTAASTREIGRAHV